MITKFHGRRISIGYDIEKSVQERVLRRLEQRPMAAGYANADWTCRRVAVVIRRRFGVLDESSSSFVC
jgi:hypothetical protein